ncbi:MAG: PKD domain-containing protein [Actinobacteria bacterium]|nr:PKD domain-containing protein [Actinomycetota bacterium]
MIRRLLIALAVLVPALVVPVTTPGQAVQVSHDQLVSDDPADWTPDVLDGEVKSIVAVGDQMVVSGTFTQVQESGGGEVLARERIFAFDARTGVINRSFAPSINGEVTTVLPDPGGAAVFAAGSFTSVNGTTNRKLTRLDLADGGISDSFRNVAVDAKVTDLRFVHGELILGGSFTSVQGIPRTGLASVNPATGDLTDFMDVNIADPLRGTMNVYKMDVTPDQDRLVFIGNFATVESQSRPQLAVLETGGPTATLADWASPFYALDACDERWWSYMRDVDIDSTGTYFVITTSGAYRGPDAPCDMEARWEVDQTGVDLDPTWRAYTGGDTTYAVAVTDSVVYVGGHMRWFNNPWAWNQWGAGGVSRMGIAALDPKNGLPFSWNPGRNPRGVGVFDIHSTDQGLWIGSDTDWVAGEQHRKLAFFPLEGGGRLPAERVGALPNDVFTLSDASGTEDSLRFRFLDGDTGIGGGESYTGDENGPDQWQDARGAVLIDDTLYTAWADGTFRAHPVNGRDIGEGVVQDLYGDPEAKGADEWFGTDARSVTGMFFDPETHRLYYTMDGDPTLWWRAFTPESGVVGAARFPAQGETDGLRPERIQGMFSAGDHFYFADATEGHLYRTGFEGGAVTGSPELVDDHVDWRGRGMFLWNAEPATLEPADPVAVPSITCAGLTCDFDGTESTDTDGYVADWDWELGDGSFEEGRLVRYTYGTPGTYDVRLTVTDNSGRSHSVNVPVSVTRPPATNIRFQGARSASANWTSVSVASPPGIEAGDGLLLFVTTSQPAAVSPPDGWTKVGEQSGRELVTQLFSAVADGSAAGNVTVDLDRIVKADATLLAYSGTSVDDPVLDWASLREFDRTGAHEAPDTRVDADTTRLIHYWADKSSATTSWQTPDGFDRRSQSIGSGSGRVNSVVVDRAVTPEPTGWIPGSVATANDASDKATMWTLRLRAEPSELPPAAVDPVAVLDVSCVDLVCELDGSGSHDADGEVVSWSWDHGDGSSSEGVSSSHVFAGAGEYPVTLTVTDDSGASASASQVVSVSEPPAAVDTVEAVGSATASENETSTSLTIPSVVESGDLMLLFVTTNEAVDVASVPSGWELIGEEPGRQIVTRLYQRVASASDAGSTLTVEMATVIKTDLTLLAYRGASPVDPASDWASASESDKAMEHAAPGLAAWDGASVIVNYWSDKTSSATGWSAPSSHTLRSESVGSGGGRITSLAADLSWATGAVPSFTAASDAETSKATMWSVRLRPS